LDASLVELTSCAGEAAESRRESVTNNPERGNFVDLGFI
jgi:hypothetical protein